LVETSTTRDIGAALRTIRRKHRLSHARVTLLGLDPGELARALTTRFAGDRAEDTTDDGAGAMIHLS
jgi:hypothetical protein